MILLFFFFYVDTLCGKEPVICINLWCDIAVLVVTDQQCDMFREVL